VLLLLVACAPDAPPAALSACDDFACRKEWVATHGAADADATLKDIGGVGDGVEQEALVNALAKAGGTWAPDACAAMPEGSARTRCRQIAERPHLRREEPAPGTPAQGADACMTGGIAPPKASPWAGIAPAALTCAEGRGEVECRTTAASDAARAGRPAEAAGICAGLTDEKWRLDCFFQAAEAASQSHRPGGTREAARLCLGADRFVGNCLGHVAAHMGARAPDVADDAAWIALRGEVDALLGELAGEPGLGERAESRIWSGVLARAYLDAPVVTGDPIDAIGPGAVAHARSAAALRLLEGGDLDGLPLADAAARVNERLAARADAPAAPRGSEPHRNLRVLDTIGKLRAGEDVVPLDCWLGSGRRPVDADPALDATLALVEASAQLGGERLALAREGLKHPSWIVRWSAARAVTPQTMPALRQRAAAGEENPVVKARLLGG
jgi:hypothetical protein